MRKLVIIAAFLLIGISAFGYTGQDLHDWWQEYQVSHDSFLSGMNVGLYSGYILSTWELILALQSSGDIPMKIDNNPDRKLGEVCEVVGKYVDAHPEYWSHPVFMLVLTALYEAYPLKTVSR